MTTPVTQLTALVTGASSGLGKEFAHLLAKQGYTIVLLARREDALKRLASTLKEQYRVNTHVMVKDLSVPGAAKEVHNELKSKQLYVDVLINNAGFGDYQAFCDASETKMGNMMQVNMVALTELTRLLLPRMKKMKRGKVLNIASTAAFQPGPGMAVYFATKAYVLSFTEAIAEELKDSAVHISCLCPGPTATEFAAEANNQNTKMFSKPMNAHDVASLGMKALNKGKVVQIAGWKNNVKAFATRILPRRTMRSIMGRFMK